LSQNGSVCGTVSGAGPMSVAGPGAMARAALGTGTDAWARAVPGTVLWL